MLMRTDKTELLDPKYARYVKYIINSILYHSKRRATSPKKTVYKRQLKRTLRNDTLKQTLKSFNSISWVHAHQKMKKEHKI